MERRPAPPRPHEKDQIQPQHDPQLRTAPLPPRVQPTAAPTGAPPGSLAQQFESAVASTKQCWFCGAIMSVTDSYCPKCLKSQSPSNLSPHATSQSAAQPPAIDESYLDSAFAGSGSASAQPQTGPKAIPAPLRPLPRDNAATRAERVRSMMTRGDSSYRSDAGISFRAWVALIVSILAFGFPLQWLFSLGAIILSGKALSEIDRSGGKMQGRGAARAAIILGILGLVSGIVFKRLR